MATTDTSGDSSLVTTHRDVSARTVLVEVTGDIDVTTGTKMRTALGDQLADPAIDHVIVDLRPVEFMSSTGVAALVDVRGEAEHLGKHLCVVAGDNRAVRRPLQMSGVDNILDLQMDLPSGAPDREGPA